MKRLALVLVLASLCGACDPLASFELGSDHAYCGYITTASHYREGFSPRVQMRLRLDVSKIGTDETVGTLSTYDKEAGTSARLFDNAPLRPIPAMAHDPLSDLEFGDGRERNMLYAVTPKDHQSESVLAVLSLRHDNQVEVRLLRPGKQFDPQGQPSGAAQRPLFGLFSLGAQKGDCGF